LLDVSANFGAEDVRGDIPFVVGCLTRFDDLEARAVMAEKVALVEMMEGGISYTSNLRI